MFKVIFAEFTMVNHHIKPPFGEYLSTFVQASTMQIQGCIRFTTRGGAYCRAAREIQTYTCFRQEPAGFWTAAPNNVWRDNVWGNPVGFCLGNHGIAIGSVGL